MNIIGGNSPQLPSEVTRLKENIEQVLQPALALKKWSGEQIATVKKVKSEVLSTLAEMRQNKSLFNTYDRLDALKRHINSIYIPANANVNLSVRDFDFNQSRVLKPFLNDVIELFENTELRSILTKEIPLITAFGIWTIKTKERSNYATFTENPHEVENGIDLRSEE